MWRAMVLVIIAGFVDAVGFLALAGTFVAFMSGNTSAGGALAGTFDVARAARQLFPLPFFVAGIYVGALVVQAAPQQAQHRRYATVLAVEFGLIALVLGAATLAGVRGANLATTYVTGTLHVAAQALARATVLARRARGAASRAPGARTGASQAAQVGVTSLAVWAGFLVGALSGGVLFARSGLAALLLPLALLLVLVTDTLRHPRP